MSVDLEYKIVKQKLLPKNKQTNFDFKFQVFLSHQDRKTNLSVRFLGEVMARQSFQLGLNMNKNFEF